jgi:hypothetical protein
MQDGAEARSVSQGGTDRKTALPICAERADLWQKWGSGCSSGML